MFRGQIITRSDIQRVTKKHTAPTPSSRIAGRGGILVSSTDHPKKLRRHHGKNKKAKKALKIISTCAIHLYPKHMLPTEVLTPYVNSTPKRVKSMPRVVAKPTFPVSIAKPINHHFHIPMKSVMEKINAKLSGRP